MKELEFGVAADLFMTPTAELCDYVLPATSFLEMANITTAFEHRRQGKTHLQYRAGRHRAFGRAALRYLDHIRVGETPGIRRTNSGTATSKLATLTSLQPSGVTLEQLKNSPAGISLAGGTELMKSMRMLDKDGKPSAALPHRQKKSSFTASLSRPMAFPPMPEYVEPADQPAQPTGHRGGISAHADQREIHNFCP